MELERDCFNCKYFFRKVDTEPGGSGEAFISPADEIDDSEDCCFMSCT